MERIFDSLQLSPLFQTWLPPLWTLLLASFALLDFGGCFPQWVDGWTEGRKQTQDFGALHGMLIGNKSPSDANGTEFCPANAIEEDPDGFCTQGRLWLWNHSHLIGVIFCCLCIIESIRRALEARQIALDMEALNEFEKTLAKVYSATKVNFFWGPPDEMTEEDTVAVVRQFIRVWTPVVSNIVGWCLILPWPLLAYYFFTPKDRWSSAEFVCGEDPALATIWITQSAKSLYENVAIWHEEFTAWIWRSVLPFALPVQLWLKPLKLIQRLRLISKWIRYVRYAGPLLRLLLKLQDQFRVFGKTWRQTWTANSEKAKRLASRSLLFNDIQRLESLTKFHSRLASFPSQFQFGGRKEVPIPIVTTMSTADSTISEAIQSRPDLTISSSDEDDPMDPQLSILPVTPQRSNMTADGTVGTPLAAVAAAASPSSRPGVAILIAKKQQESRRLQWRLNHLKKHFYASSRQTSELYDRMVELTREATRQVHSAFWNKHLISPQTRFSVGWRLIVTFALLSELGRLLMSYQLSRTFDLRYRDLTLRLLGLCQKKSHPIRKWIGKVAKLPANHPWLDTCHQSSPTSQFSLSAARWSEVIIDCIGFLDILVWFYTGELDESGILVVPKPFFTRCILPGTLIQVIDHPTVPKVIPHYTSYFFQAARAVGYSRVWRWALALYPAIHMLLIAPIQRYLFSPMGKDEYLSYTESLLQFRPGSTSRGSLLRSNRHLLGMDQANLSDHTRRIVEEPAEEIDEDDDDEDNSSLLSRSFLPRVLTRSSGLSSHPRSGSYSNVLHASISENDGYGLFYY